MISQCQIQRGSVWLKKDRKDIMTVISIQRAGHQYDRHFICECLKTSGEIVELEDYQIFIDYDCTLNA
jgi:hypothetical protein